MVAAFYGSLDCIDILIRRGADVNLRNHAGKSVLEFTETHEDSQSDVRAVQSAIYSAQAALANPLTVENDEEEENEEEQEENDEADAVTLLFEAAKAGDIDGVNACLVKGVEIDTTDEDGYTPLMHAAAIGHLDLVRYLIENGANANQQDEHRGDTALMLAVRYGQIDVVEWLVCTDSADVELVNVDGENVLTIEPIEKVTKEQMMEVLANALEHRSANDGGSDQPVTADGGDNSAQQDESPIEANNVNENESKYSQQQHPSDSQSYYSADSHQSLPPSQPSSFPSSSDPSTASSAGPPPRPVPTFDPRDARAFLELSLPQALSLVNQRYKSVCADFGETPSAYIMAGVANIAHPGQALLLSGASAGQGNKERLNDATLYPLLEVLAYSFPTCPITTLDLSMNHLGKTSAAGLSMLLNACQTLTHLDLSGNDLDRAAGEAIADALMQPTCSIVKLNLHTNPIGPYAIAKFAQVLQVNTKLLELNLGNVECETLSLMKIATSLQSNHTLKRLNLDSPLLYSCQEETTIHLARSLALNTSLIALSLKGHHLTDDGARWIAHYILPNSHLTDINLSRNQLTTTGVKHFIPTLAHRRVECLITLDGNLLTGQTFEEIEEAIQDAKEQRARNTIVFNSRQDRHSLRAKAPL